MYDCDPGQLLETARLIEEDGCEVNASVGCKAEGRSMAVTL